MEPDAETGRGAGTRGRDAETGRGNGTRKRTRGRDAETGRGNGTRKRTRGRVAETDADRDAETGLAPRFGGPGTRNSGRNLQIREILRTFGAPNGKMQEWLNWPAWKASKPLKGFRGSNPLLSADVRQRRKLRDSLTEFFHARAPRGDKKKRGGRRSQTQGPDARIGRKGRAQMASGAGVERKDRARIPGRYSFPRAKKAVWRFALFFVI